MKPFRSDIQRFLLGTATIAIAFAPEEVHSRICNPRESPTINLVSSATATSANDLAPAVEAFRELLGGVNNGNDAFSNPSGNRQIDWDAAAVPFNMPGDFFARNVTRGLVVGFFL